MARRNRNNKKVNTPLFMKSAMAPKQDGPLLPFMRAPGTSKAQHVNHVLNSKKHVLGSIFANNKAKVKGHTLGRMKVNTQQPQEQSQDSGDSGDSGGSGGGGGGGSSQEQSQEQEEQEQPQASQQSQQEEEEEEEESEEEEEEEETGEEEESEEEQPHGEMREEIYGENSASRAHFGKDVSFPLVSSHIRNNKLHTSAITCTPHGFFLVHCKSKCNGKPGPVKVGEEDIKPTVINTLAHHRAALTNEAVVQKQKHYAGELVERARVGDQNAMAILACIRDNAKNGHPVARQSLNFLKLYIEKNPVTPNVGAESVKNTKHKENHWASTMLANGPLLSNARINQFCMMLGDYMHAFIDAMKSWREKEKAEHQQIDARFDEIYKQLTDIGKIVGHARAIQAVRMPTSPVSLYSPTVGWELGE